MDAAQSGERPSRLALNTSRALLVVIALYLCLGNLPRVIPLPGFSDNLAISEFLVYVIAPLVALSQGRLIACLKPILPLLLIIWLSFAWGTFLNGFDSKSCMYAIRLGLQLLAGTIGGDVLFRLYQHEPRRALSYFLRIYLALLAFGAAIFTLFPESTRLWAVLSRFGVTFLGDPHVYRFYSTYLDPNFYAAIAIIPVLLALALHRMTRLARYQVGAILFIVSILLSGSRSGIVTALLVLLALNLRKASFLWTLKVSKRAVASAAAALIGLLCLSPLYLASVTRMMNRLVGMQSDGSALQRLKSFLYGVGVFAEHPIMGVGYNYLAFRTAVDAGSQKLDSSVLYIVTNFGLMMTWVLMLLFVLWLVNVSRRFSLALPSQRYLVLLFKSLLVYVVICLVFAGQFNNLIFYQFWLLPIVMVLAYLSRVFHAWQRSPNEGSPVV